MSVIIDGTAWKSGPLDLEFWDDTEADETRVGVGIQVVHGSDKYGSTGSVFAVHWFLRDVDLRSVFDWKIGATT